MLSREQLKDKIYACWLGKNIGGTLGTPVEGSMEPLSLTWYPHLPDTGALPNDDLDLQLVGLHALEQRGACLTAGDLAAEWCEHVFFPWDEYGYALSAMRLGFKPPFSGCFDNPFIHCMGAPIRSEIWAAVCAGRPEAAAAFAKCDAIVDHAGGEGMYGEIFLAALEAAAFESDDVPTLLQQALKSIPETSRVHKAVALVMELHDKGVTLPDVRKTVLREQGSRNFTHAAQNIAFTVAGLLWGDGFEDGLLKTVNLGYDTDCTAATFGALYGILYGTAGIPEKWSAPIGSAITVSAMVRGLDVPVDLEELTERTLRMHDILACVGTQQLVRCVDDSEDYTVQTAVFPQGSARDKGLEVRLHYLDEPTLARDKTCPVSFTFINHTTGVWHMRLSIRGEGVQAAQRELRLEPGASVDWYTHLQTCAPFARLIPCDLSIERLHDSSVWTRYHMPFTVLRPAHWFLNGAQVAQAGTLVTFPEGAQDGVYVAQATLYCVKDRMTQIICACESPFTVELDGKEILRSEGSDGWMPAYHRAPVDQKCACRLRWGRHVVRVTIRSDEPPQFGFATTATADVAEPGEFYAYIDNYIE